MKADVKDIFLSSRHGSDFSRSTISSRHEYLRSRGSCDTSRNFAGMCVSNYKLCEKHQESELPSRLLKHFGTDADHGPI